ncbi:hypothetical protein O6P37_15850 [Mycobacterium sp. CPCC 205372]|uniref:Uncharacterized protein n=1 Tax=Mycobacterium hippophais TaxID=3016340 RepID=A0ABT4PUV4_9MYCO|nr:hypothetical protein [Mycobacterium hippophais]MCZ8380343.1 hypothetical protein [Mycobacterium hippophais]
MSDRNRIPRWLWAIAAAALILLTIAIVGRSDGPTLQAIAAGEAMSDEQARKAAEKTLLAWTRERNAGHFENLRELTCADPPDTWVSRQLDHARAGTSLEPWNIAALTGFTREGTTWTINGNGVDHGGMFTLRVESGRLRVCAMGPVPVPTS